MKFDNFVSNNLCHIKVTYVFYYAFFLVCFGNNLPLGMVFVFLSFLFESRMMAFGIIGLASMYYLLYTGYYFEKRWNYWLTIICISCLVALTAIPIQNALANEGRFAYVFILASWVMAAFLIYGYVLRIRELNDKAKKKLG